MTSRTSIAYRFVVSNMLHYDFDWAPQTPKTSDDNITRTSLDRMCSDDSYTIHVHGVSTIGGNT